MLNLCQLIWECWGDNPNSAAHHGMLLFDLDQWYKDQMPGMYYRIEYFLIHTVDACNKKNIIYIYA